MPSWAHSQALGFAWPRPISGVSACLWEPLQITKSPACQGHGVEAVPLRFETLLNAGTLEVTWAPLHMWGWAHGLWTGTLEVIWAPLQMWGWARGLWGPHDKIAEEIVPVQAGKF